MISEKDLVLIEDTWNTVNKNKEGGLTIKLLIGEVRELKKSQFSPEPGKIMLKFNIDTLLGFLKKIKFEYHLPEYEMFLDELEEGLFNAQSNSHKSNETTT